jgi:hypothetical protein
MSSEKSLAQVEVLKIQAAVAERALQKYGEQQSDPKARFALMAKDLGLTGTLLNKCFVAYRQDTEGLDTATCASLCKLGKSSWGPARSEVNSFLEKLGLPPLKSQRGQGKRTSVVDAFEEMFGEISFEVDVADDSAE